MQDETTTYQVNGQPLAEPEERTAPTEGITEAEIEEFDKVARASFEREWPKHLEVRPGSAEAEAAVRDAIRQGN
jgi:hypothetical protein